MSKRLDPKVVLDIDKRTKDGESPESVAGSYGLNSKTVDRIMLGLTWGHVTGNKFTGTLPVDALQKLTRLPRKLSNLKRANILDIDPANEALVTSTREALASHLGLLVELEWSWGRYRAWDGIFSVVTDGRVAWISEKLALLFAKLAYTELPTFPLGQVFSYPPEEELEPIVHENDYTVTLSGRTFWLPKRMVEIAKKQELQIRRAGDRLDFLYLTPPPKNKRDQDGVPPAHACVALTELQLCQPTSPTSTLQQ